MAMLLAPATLGPQQLSLGAFPATPFVDRGEWVPSRDARSLPHAPSTALLCRG